MNFNEAMQMLGSKLQGKYGHLGFKYKKSDKTLTRHSKNFTYMIAFSSFGGNTKDSISIEVCYIINTPVHTTLMVMPNQTSTHNHCFTV